MVLAVQELRRNEEHRAAAASYSVLPRQNNVPFFFFLMQPILLGSFTLRLLERCVWSLPTGRRLSDKGKRHRCLAA